MDKMKVLILTTISHGGGTERLILDQLKYYNKSKFNLNLAILKKGNIDDKMRLECQKQKANYYNINSTNPIIAAIRIRKIIKSQKIQVLHCNLFHAEIIALILRFFYPRLKILISKHNTDQFRKKKFWQLIGYLTSRCANGIICVSDAVSEFVQKYEHIDKSKIIVVKNGIDISKFKKMKVDRTKIGLNSADFVIGIVGRIEEQKNHQSLILAVRNLEKKIPSLKLLIVGTGYLENDMKLLVAKYNLEKKVIFAGFQENTNYFYNCMDVFCLPSIYEGFGLVVVEAMDTETPVIVSKIDGIREIVSEKEGILFNPNNIKEMEEKLLFTYKNINKKIILNKVKNAKEKSKLFNIKDNILKIEQIYENQVKN